jgi:hypothetical protein
MRKVKEGVHVAGRLIRNPFAFLFVRQRRDEYVQRYVVREFASGRSLDEILDDPYVRNRTTDEQRARLLEEPELIAALGAQAARDLEARA